ncbi:hypothetical protein IC235_09250 [Hymenobacter sp. BT664]|uniref:Uncharacterized protein n=1 Tax=Hymenobacter montanus TaxID=2771359 RepID=A0A927BD38_9BACT|nr:hypothetical protein [Hymenobacter montanus]MBD2768075.1 hypothetical protein [Hymenobacter montanus]
MSTTPQRGATRQRTPFTGAEASPLDLRTAARWTATERRQNPDQARAFFFGRDIIERILAQPGCMGLRVHYAIDPSTGQRHLLIVGADAEQNDQLPPLEPTRESTARSAAPPEAATESAETIDETTIPDYIIAEMAIPCPNQCGDSNQLNGYA